MKNISIQVDENTFKDFSVACAQSGTQKKSILIKLIQEFIEDAEDAKLYKLAERRLKDLESGKSKTVKFEDAWK
jgi:predicted DNA-binding protein